MLVVQIRDTLDMHGAQSEDSEPAVWSSEFATILLQPRNSEEFASKGPVTAHLLSLKLLLDWRQLQVNNWKSTMFNILSKYSKGR